MLVAWSLAGRRLVAGGPFGVGRNHPKERGSGWGWGEALEAGTPDPEPRAMPAPLPGGLQGTLLEDLSETLSTLPRVLSQLWRAAVA